MAQTIKLKRSATAGGAPTTSQIALGEVAINTYDGKMYIKKSVGGTESIVEISGGDSGTGIIGQFLYTATAGQTAFSGNDDNNASLVYVIGSVQVFLNGILLDPDTDYTATNGALLTLVSAASANDLIQLFSFNKKIGDANVTVNSYSGNGSTTGFTLSINPGDETNTRVYVDGVYQSKANYSVSGTTLTFSTAPPSGTAIEVESGNRSVTIPTTENLDFPDNVKLRLGTSQDLEIYHNSSDSLINDNGTGSLKLQTGGSTKLEVTSTGVDVTGSIVVSGTVDGIDIAARDGVLTSTTTTAGAALPKAGGAMTGAITTNSTFDGRDVATDGTKLDGIETSATADQTQSEINALGITATGLSGTPAISVANITTTGELRGPASLVIDPAGVGDNTGTVVIKGNLQVDGSQTTINSTTVNIDDLNLTLASGAANGNAANGAGLTIDGASATLTYASAGDNWAFNKNLAVTGAITSSGKLYINQPSSNTNNELIIMRANDVYADQIWTDNSGSIRLRTSSGAFDVFTGGAANSITASGATTRLSINAAGNATFAGTINSGAITSTGIIKSDTSNGLGSLQLNSNGNKAIVGLEPSVGGGSVNDLSIYSRSGAVRFWASGVQKMTLTSSGLAVTGTATFSGKTTMGGDGAIVQIANSTAADSSNTYTLAVGSQSGNKSILAARDINTSGGGYQINGTTVIDASRNLTNIGTIASGAITVTADNSYFRDDDNVGIYLQTTAQGTGSTDGVRIGLNSAHGFVWNYEAKPLAFATSGTERLSIGATGPFDFKTNNLTNIGTIASGNITAPKFIMTGGSQIGQDYAYLKSNSTSTASLTLRKNASGADAIDFLQLRNNANGLIGKIEGDGDISFNNATFAAGASVGGKLLVSDGGNATVAALQLGDAGTGISRPSTDQMNFLTADQTRMVIQAGGNVGIGTTSPTFTTPSGSTSQKGLNIQNSGNDTSAHLRLTGHNNSGGSPGQPTYFELIHRGDALVTDFSHNGTVRMSINSAGNIGIGTPAPTELLHIKNPSNSWNQYARIRIGTETSDSYASEIGFHRGTSSDADRGLFLDGSGAGNQQLKVLVNGNVGIGTATPAFKLVVAHNSRNSMEFVPNTADTGTNILQNYNRGTSAYTPFRIAGKSLTIQSGTNAQYSWVFDESGNLASPDSGGKVGIGTSSPFSRLQSGGNTFSGGHGMYANARVGISNHGSLTGLMLASTYNDANHPEYGLVFVQGPSTSSYNVWSISPDGPAKGTGLNFHYGAQATNIHGASHHKVTFKGDGKVGIGTTTPKSTLEIQGAIAISNGDTDLGTHTHSTYASRVDNGCIKFTAGYSGTMAAGRTFVFKYDAVSWKAYHGTMTIASTQGFSKHHFGGYWNNSGSHDIDSFNGGAATCAVSTSGQAIIVTLTLTAGCTHPMVSVEYHQSGGDGAPRLDRAEMHIQ